MADHAKLRLELFLRKTLYRSQVLGQNRIHIRVSMYRLWYLCKEVSSPRALFLFVQYSLYKVSI